MKQSAIHIITAEEILDSRGNPTVSATVTLENGTHGSASVPSGASTGQYESLELRDGDPRRYNGKGVLQACSNIINAILPALRGKDVHEQQHIDQTMIKLDGTQNKSTLGANAILAVSLACARAGAETENVPLHQYLRATYHRENEPLTLPIPMLNIINGGRHADNGLDFQEYMILPHATTFAERMRIGAEISMELGSLLRSKGLSTLVGDEGGFAPRFSTNTEPLDLIMTAIGRTAYRPGKDVTLGLDVAASEFFLANKQHYFLALEHAMVDADDLIARYAELAQSYPVTSIEDGLSEDDWNGWARLTDRLHESMLLIGDDLFVTNRRKLERGIREHVANAILVKPNQIGTLTETMETVAVAQSNGYVPVISHRSGETDDAFIADLAVAVHAPYIKAGAVARGERLAKYNRLMDIETSLV